MITMFGSINLDLVVCLPRLPVAGETVSGPDHQTFPGGKGANQALAARRAGAQVRMISAVGMDAFAELALANLSDGGIDLSGVRSLPGSTGLALIGIDPSGENQIIVASGTNARIQADWLPTDMGPDDILMAEGEAPYDQVVQAMIRAKKGDALIFWNPAPVPEGDIRDALEITELLVVNENEAALIGGALGLASSAEAFLDHFASGDRTVVVTQGARGIVADEGSKRIRVSAPVIHSVDSTGAGDAFCGALAAAIDDDVPFERALREGVAAGALACTVTGAQSSAPLKSDIVKLADQIE